MAKVYAAFDMQKDEKVVLKFLAPEFQKDEEMLTRFRLEFNTLFKLNHENLTAVYEFRSSERGIPYFIMEFIEGQEITQTTFEVKKFYKFLRQILSVFKYVHSNGIIHGDIKPANILVTKNDEIKILDFGLSHRINEFRSTNISGTIEYLPPEILKGQPFSFQTDLYSIGIVLYEILVGELPYSGEDFFSEFIGKNTNPVTSPFDKNKAVPQKLSDIVMKLIERDASIRYQTINEVIEDLNKILTEPIPLKGQQSSYVLGNYFVSRKDQLNTLKIIHSGATRGTGKSVLLTGESGIGKTRLLKEFEFYLQFGEDKVIYQSFSPNPEIGFRTWLPILLKCFKKYATQEEIFEYGNIFVKFIPELRNYYDFDLTTSTQKEQLEFFNKIADFFLKLSRGKAFILILEDINFASPTNLKLIKFLVSKFIKSSVTLFLSTSIENGTTDFLNENLIRVKIPKFNASEAAALIASKLGLKAEPIEFGKRLLEVTDGLPIFIEECILYLLNEEILHREDDAWRSKIKDYNKIPFPETFEELTVTRFKSLAKKEREILHFASCLQKPFRLKILKEFTNTALETLIDILDELVKENFLTRKVLQHGIEYSFVHLKVKEIVNKQLPLKKPFKVISNYFEKEGEEVNAISLANAFAKVESWGKALKYYSIAADFSYEITCYEEASELFEKFLENYSKYEYSNPKKVIETAITFGKICFNLKKNKIAQKALAEAVELAKTDQSESLLCKALLYEGICFTKSNELANAFQVLEQAKSLAKKISEKELLAKIEYRIAEVLISQNNFLAAVDHLILAKEIATETQNHKLAFKTKLNLARNFWNHSNFSEAQQLLKEIFRDETRKEFPTLLIEALLLNADLNFQLNKFELALDSYHKALELSQNFGTPESVCDIYYKLGKSNFYLSHYKNAFSFFEHSLLLAEQVGNFEFQIKIHTEIGELYRLTGNFKKSIDHLNKAISGLERTPFDELKAQIYHNLGKLYSELRNPLESIDFYEKSLMISESNKFHSLRSSNLIGIARVNRLQKTNEKTILSKLEEALNIASQHSASIEEAISLYELGEFYRLQNNYEQALKFYQKSISIAEKIRLDFYIAKNYLKMGIIYLKEKNLNRTILCLDGAQKIYAYLPLPKLEINIQKLEIQLAKEEKKFFRAFSASEKAIQTAEKVSESLENERMREKYLKGFNGFYKERFLCFLKAHQQDKLYDEIISKDIQNWAELFEKYREKILQNAVEDLEEEAKQIQTVIPEETETEFVPPKEEGFRRTPPKAEKSSIAQHYLTKLIQISQKLNVIREEEKLLQTTLDLLIEAVNAEHAVIFLLDEATSELIPKVTGKSEVETVRDAYKISETVLHDVVQKGKPVVCLNAKSDPRYQQRQSIAKYQITSFICVPLSFAGKIFGTVYVDKRSNERALNNEDLDFIVAFASQAAIALENAKLTSKLEEENRSLKAEVQRKYHFAGIVGESKAMQKVFATLGKVIKSESTVVVTGESGTGKELIAKAIHYNGARKDKPFIAVNCSELPETLENELFGHSKGSFTGAVFDKKGLFEEAHEGTIFLDEITNTSLGFQAKLLRVLQEREVRRVGEAIPRKVNVRVIAATNVDLMQMVKDKTFREDLYYRLNVIQISLPPLAKREGDIEALTKYFLKENSERMGEEYKISKTAMRILLTYGFPGNVRQLSNIIERATVLCDNNTIEKSDLIDLVDGEDSNGDLGLNTYTLSDIEKHVIQEVLELNNWEYKKSSEMLGISRTTLYSKVSKHGLEKN